MNLQPIVTAYSRALAFGGSVLLLVVLFLDQRWTAQLPEIVVMLVACVMLRSLHIPLSKYSYLTQTSLVALVGGLLVGVPATVLAVAIGVVLADTVWQRKAGYVAWIVWPSRSAMRSPAPSLPLAGTERPPVARTTADAWISPSSMATRHGRSPTGGLRAVTRASKAISTSHRRISDVRCSSFRACSPRFTASTFDASIRACSRSERTPSRGGYASRRRSSTPRSVRR